jgi:HEAT repeat protein
VRRCLILIVLGLTADRSEAYIDASPTLGSVIADSTFVTVLKVEKVSRDKQVVIYTKVADLKGKGAPDIIKHKLTEGFHPRQLRTILDWAEPGKVAICFHDGRSSLTCIGGFWYHCAATDAQWWTMTAARPELSYAYFGSTAKLRDHVTAIVAAKEVVVTALKYAAFEPGKGERKLEGWATYEAVSSGRLMRGKDWPVWRVRVSLKMPPLTHIVVLREPGKWLVGDGPADPDDVPTITAALKHDDALIRRDAAEDLGAIGAPAAAATPTLLRLCREDPDPLVRIEAAKAVARIDPKDETPLPLLAASLKDRVATVRKRAAECLGDLGPAAKPAIPELVTAVKDPDPVVGWAAIDALGQIGPSADAAVPALIEALKEANTRGAAIDALGLIGHNARNAIPALERLLEGDAIDRWATAAALVRIGGRGARPGVRYFLKAADPTGGKKLYDAAIVLAAPSAPEALRELIDAVREKPVRDTATTILRDKSFVPLSKDQIADAKKFLEDMDAAVRSAAAWVLYCRRGQPGVAIDVKAMVAVFADSLKAADPWARRQAAQFLGSLGGNARGAVLELTAARDDRDEGVRTAAAEALKRIGK